MLLILNQSLTIVPYSLHGVYLLNISPDVVIFLFTILDLSVTAANARLQLHHVHHTFLYRSRIGAPLSFSVQIGFTGVVMCSIPSILSRVSAWVFFTRCTGTKKGRGILIVHRGQGLGLGRVLVIFPGLFSLCNWGFLPVYLLMKYYQRRQLFYMQKAV